MYLDCGAHGTKKNLLTIMQAQTNPINFPNKWADVVVQGGSGNTGVAWVGDGSLDSTKIASALAVIQAETDFYEFKSLLGNNLVFANSIWIYVPAQDNFILNVSGIQT